MSNWRLDFESCAEVEIIDYFDNNGCTDEQVLKLEYYFKYCAKRLTTSSAHSAVFDLAQYCTSKEHSVDKFILTIERQRIDETNRFCNETEDLDVYTGTFTHKTNGTSTSMHGHRLCETSEKQNTKKSKP